MHFSLPQFRSLVLVLVLALTVRSSPPRKAGASVRLREGCLNQKDPKFPTTVKVDIRISNSDRAFGMVHDVRNRSLGCVTDGFFPPGMGTPPLPWAAVPCLNNPFREEIFLNIQSKPSLEQLEVISSCPCSLGADPDPTCPSPPVRELCRARRAP
uniref:Uncharacterized protein n=1 Tax=Cyanistes caeruleus TaxID=156563 RepID=A0A8C0VA66_CYACU